MPIGRWVVCGALWGACAVPRAGSGSGDNGGNNAGGEGGNRDGTGGRTHGAGKGGAGSSFQIEFPDAPLDSDGGTNAPGENADVLQECGAFRFAVERTPPELMLVLDRSGSMVRLVDGGNPSPGSLSRWDYTTQAIDAVLGQTEDNIAWGFKMYPTCNAAVISGSPGGCEFPRGSLIHNPCATTGVISAPALSQHAAIAAVIRDNAPALDRGATPTTPAIDDAVELLKQRTTANPRFLLLATDGVPNCGLNGSNQRDFTLDDSAGAIAAVKRSVAAGFPVFVLGIAISDNPGSAPGHDFLNQLAIAGGRARDGVVKYFPALDQAQLAAGMAEIAAATISCTFPLQTAPPDDAQAGVDVDGKRLPEDAANGWSLASSRKAIIFNGLACEALKRGEFKQTAVTFGCPGEPLPPPAL